MSYTPGTWKLSPLVGDVVITDPTENTPPEVIKWYGGSVIGESISSDDDRKLISAAPDLLVACQKAYESLDSIMNHCGQDLQVYGWHLNGDAEPFDNFINDNMDGDEMELLYKAISKAKGGIINE